MDAILSAVLNIVITYPKPLLYWLAATFVFWFLFASAMTLYYKRQNYSKRDWQWWGLSVVGLPVFAFGFPYDILYNLTWGNLIFMQLPRRRKQGEGISAFEWTFTARLKRLVKQDRGWRGKLAKLICEKLVEPWDWNHCGLANR